METATVKEMFRALFRNDQAMTMVVAIVMINTALYITSNLVIYFFKYDFSPEAWQSNYTLFNTFGGAFQILAMMILFPLLRIYEYDKDFLRKLFHGICRISDPSCDCILRKYQCLSASGSGIPYYVSDGYAECHCDDFSCKYGRLRGIEK